MFNPDWLESDPVSTFICQGLTRQNNTASLSHTHTLWSAQHPLQLFAIRHVDFPSRTSITVMCRRHWKDNVTVLPENCRSGKSLLWLALIPGCTQAQPSPPKKFLIFLQSQFNNYFRVAGGGGTQSWTENSQYLIFQQMPHITHNDVISGFFFF